MKKELPFSLFLPLSSSGRVFHRLAKPVAGRCGSGSWRSCSLGGCDPGPTEVLRGCLRWVAGWLLVTWWPPLSEGSRWPWALHPRIPKSELLIQALRKRSYAAWCITGSAADAACAKACSVPTSLSFRLSSATIQFCNTENPPVRTGLVLWTSAANLYIKLLLIPRLASCSQVSPCE